jgi:hypothetical protein
MNNLLLEGKRDIASSLTEICLVLLNLHSYRGPAPFKCDIRPRSALASSLIDEYVHEHGQTDFDNTNPEKVSP